jgi:hypothetical protein
MLVVHDLEVGLEPVSQPFPTQACRPILVGVTVDVPFEGLAAFL